MPKCIAQSVRELNLHKRRVTGHSTCLLLENHTLLDLALFVKLEADQLVTRFERHRLEVESMLAFGHFRRKTFGYLIQCPDLPTPERSDLRVSVNEAMKFLAVFEPNRPQDESFRRTRRCYACPVWGNLHAILPQKLLQQ